MMYSEDISSKQTDKGLKDTKKGESKEGGNLQPDGDEPLKEKDISSDPLQ